MKIEKILNIIIDGTATVYAGIRYAPYDHWTVYVSSVVMSGVVIYRWCL